MKVYQLHVVPEQVENFKYLMLRLKDILELNDVQYSKIIKKKNAQKPWETLIISENFFVIDEDLSTAIILQSL